MVSRTATSNREREWIGERTAARFVVNASWLIKLRSVAVTGQLITIVVVWQLMKIVVPVVPLTLVLLITTVSNAVLALWFGRRRPAEEQPQSAELSSSILGLVMTLDLISLTVMLYFTGGPNNPFAFFYFVNVSLCAVVLTDRWAWSLTAISVACMAFLLYDFIPLPIFGQDSPIDSILNAGRIKLVHYGLLLAFATCASVIVYFMTRLNHELSETEHNLWLAEARQARYDKLQALGTMAAGAAHELATPLSTIAVVAREVENELKQTIDREELVDDIELIRGELDRCRAILDRMNAEAGQATGEAPSAVMVDQLLTEVKEGMLEKNVQYRVSSEAQEVTIVAPLVALAQSIRGVIQNGLDASEPEQPVQVHIAVDSDRLHIQVCDRGEGMSEEIAHRVSEPFFTTKDPGKGMGLGMFLTRSLIEQLGGDMRIESRPGEGTTVDLALPLQQ